MIFVVVAFLGPMFILVSDLSELNRKKQLIGHVTNRIEHFWRWIQRDSHLIFKEPLQYIFATCR